MFAITSDSAYYVLRYRRDETLAKLGRAGEEEGIEDAFDVVSEIAETYAGQCTQESERERGSHSAVSGVCASVHQGAGVRVSVHRSVYVSVGLFLCVCVCVCVPS
jgi:hypothetical protein